MQNDGSISPVRAFLRNKWVRLVLIIDVIAIIAVIGILIWNATKTATINFNIAPVNAKIQIDGRGDYSNGTYRAQPGTHEITISRDGLTTKTFTLDLKSGYDATLTTFLSNNGNFEFYELKDNYESFQKLAEIASSSNNITTDHDTSAEQFISNLEQILSITDVLPIKGYVYAEPSVNSSTAGFAIRNGTGETECEKITCLLVNYYGKDYESAVMESIQDAGYNPTNYQIIYERYNN